MLVTIDPLSRQSAIANIILIWAHEAKLSTIFFDILGKSITCFWINRTLIFVDLKGKRITAFDLKEKINYLFLTDFKPEW